MASRETSKRREGKRHRHRKREFKEKKIIQQEERRNATVGGSLEAERWTRREYMLRRGPFPFSSAIGQDNSNYLRGRSVLSTWCHVESM